MKLLPVVFAAARGWLYFILRLKIGRDRDENWCFYLFVEFRSCVGCGNDRRREIYFQLEARWGGDDFLWFLQ